MKMFEGAVLQMLETFGAPKIQELAMNLSSINLFLKWDWVLVSVENACSPLR